MYTISIYIYIYVCGVGRETAADTPVRKPAFGSAAEGPAGHRISGIVIV